MEGMVSADPMADFMEADFMAADSMEDLAVDSEAVTVVMAGVLAGALVSVVLVEDFTVHSIDHFGPIQFPFQCHTNMEVYNELEQAYSNQMFKNIFFLFRL